MTTQTDTAIRSGPGSVESRSQADPAQADMTFEGDTTRLRRHASVAAGIAFALLGFSIWTTANIDRAAPIAFGDVFPAMLTLLLSAWATLVRRWLLQRLTNTPKTAPLEFRETIMRMGAMPFDIPYTSIESLTLKRSEGAEDFLARLAYPPHSLFFKAPLSVYHLKLTQHPIPYVLDLDCLDLSSLGGDTDKIPEILNSRIQHAKL